MHQGLLGSGGSEVLAQVGALGAQGGYAGDDAGLFGKGAALELSKFRKQAAISRDSTAVRDCANGFQSIE